MYENKAVLEMRRTIFESETAYPAALAIRAALEKLLAEEICTKDEFMALINLDLQAEWLGRADLIAERLEARIRSGTIHPNVVKPWQICRDYREEFVKIASIRAWRSAHGAINTILNRVSKRFQKNTAGAH